MNAIPVQVGVVACLLMVGVFSTATEHVDFDPEDPCSSQGGLCVPSPECPNSKLPKGLCPKQQAQGAECCHEIPDSVRRCRSHGGECVKECPPTITREELECPSGTACCIWLT